MLSFDEAALLLDALADELPAALLHGLNGGISLLSDEKIHPDAVSDDLYIMGEYCVSQIGRHIALYYGSFARVYRNASAEVWRAQLRAVLLHELTHHTENRAGERGLERKDEENLRRYHDQNE